MVRKSRLAGQQVSDSLVLGDLIQVSADQVSVGSRQAVRSAYLEQVRRIAPLELLGRESELAELAAFCADADGSSYAWWRAPAWAGKSALLSWFVLHPPRMVRVVSFFVTARYKSQDDRAAFTDVLLEQLAELLGQPMPSWLTEATREHHLLSMFAQAAETCGRRGEVLVLIVDGLDEDRGVTTGPDSYSIAALLPERPPGGMRVIVAGRLHPPVPDDVPSGHFLRDPAIVRVLDASPHAEVVRQDMLRELKRLLHGDRDERDLLGLVAAAGGGLSARDLAELTRLPEYEVFGQLTSVAGRTFTSRPSRWQPGGAPEVYVLGHEELQKTAASFFGPGGLQEYRQRLHDWADGYRQRGWPAGTPEYLLRGYFRLLGSTGDLPRLLACAADQARHDRTLDVTGGDAIALAEITTVQDAVLAQREPDLLSMARLALHRDSLTGRNDRIPTQLPAVWARLGRHSRAAMLAQSITDPDRQAEALAGVAEAMADVDLSRASELALSITDPDRRADALARLVATAASIDPDQAEALAGSITDMARQVAALADLLKVIVSTDPDRARRVTRRAGTLASSITDPGELAVLADLGLVVAAMDADRASALFSQAENLTRLIIDPGEQARALVRLTESVATIDPDRAEAVARSISSPALKAFALVTLAEALTRTDPGRARALVNEADALAWTSSDADLEHFRASRFGITDVVALVRLEDGASADEVRARLDRSENLLRAITDPADTARSQRHGRNQGSYPRLLARLEALARSATDPDLQEAALNALAEGVPRIAEAIAGAEPGQASALFDRLEVLVRAKIGAGQEEDAAGSAAWLAETAAGIAEAAVVADPDAARSLAERAADLWAEAEARVRCRLASGGQPEELPFVGAVMRAVPAVVQVLARADPDQAFALADNAERLVFAIGDAFSGQVDNPADLAGLAEFKAEALVALAQAMAGADRTRAGALADRAEAIARTVTDQELPARQLAGLTLLALAVARVDPDRAHLLFDRVETQLRAFMDALPDAEDLPLPAYLRAVRELLETAAAHAELVDRVFGLVRWQFSEGDDPSAGLHAILADAAADLDAVLVRTLIDQAEAVTRMIPDARQRATALGYLARLMERVDPARADALFDASEHVASSITDPAGQAGALADLAEKAASTHPDWARTLFDRAEKLTRSITEPAGQAGVLAELGEKLVSIDPGWAHALLDRAEMLACSITDSGKRADALAELAEVAATANPDRTRALFDRVEGLLPEIPDSTELLIAQSVASHLVEAMARLEPARAADLADQAERLIRAINQTRLWTWTRAGTVGDLARALAGTGLNLAEAAARSNTDLERQAQALASLAERAARLDPNRAERAQRRVEDARLARQARAVASADVGQAEILARKIADPGRQALVLTNLARTAAPAHARRLVARAFRLSFWAMPLDALAQVDPAALTAIADNLPPPSRSAG